MKTIEEQLKEYINSAKEAMISNDVPAARRLASAISEYVKQKGFKRTDQELFARYSAIIAKLKWVALPLLKKEEVFSLFDVSFEEALDMPFLNLKDKLTEAMFGLYELEERDVWKKEIKDIVNRNQATLTKTNLKSGKRGTVENWVRNYVSAIGLAIADPVKFENYFISGEDLAALGAEEISKLKDFFFFYEYLKSSSLTPAGLEDRPLFSDGVNMGILENGRLQTLKPSKEEQEIAALVEKVLSPAKPGAPAAIKIPVSAPVPAPKPLSEEEKKAQAEKLRLEEQKKRKLLDLEKIAKTSPAGGLERKAVEEEIKKVSSENTK